MSDLFINGDKVKDNFLANEKYEFNDIFGGSKNIVELKDGDTVIDKHQFTLKMPAPKFTLLAVEFNQTNSDMKVIDMRAYNDFSGGNNIVIQRKNNDENSLSLSFGKFKFALKNDVNVTEHFEEMPSLSNNDNTPTERIVPLNGEYQIFIDDVEIERGNASTDFALSMNLAPKETYEKHVGMLKYQMGCMGVSKKIEIKNVITTEDPEPQDFTFNIEWV